MSEIRVPKFGMSAVEVEILEIHVAVGDSVKEGTPVVEAASDKVDFQIEAEVDGTIAEIYCTVGEMKGMGEVLMTIAPA